MCPAMRRLLVEGAELFHQDCNSIDRLMMYVDNNLGMLHNQLNEENFKRILEIVWDSLAGILEDLIQSNLEVSNCYIFNVAVFLLQITTMTTTFNLCFSIFLFFLSIAYYFFYISIKFDIS